VITQSGSGIEDKRVEMTYDAAEQVTSLARYQDLVGVDGVVTSVYEYDLNGNLRRLTDLRGNTILRDDAYAYDALNRLIQTTSQDGTSSYSYDQTSQLVAADYTDQADEMYSYDRNGNRTNAGYETGANNQLLSDGIYDYAYDKEGNLIRQTEIATGKVTQLSWDRRSRLIAVIDQDALGTVTQQIEYRYDLYDRRIAKIVDPDGVGAAAATTERYVYDRDHIALVFDDSGQPTDRYLFGLGIDQVLAGESQGQSLWALVDHQGTVTDVVDSAGVNLNHISYDSFGNITNQTNPTAFFHFGYTGQEFDQETGNYYYWNRYYDPGTGRFLSQDPIGFGAGDTNLYRYVGNSPTNFIDPSGMLTIVIPGGYGELGTLPQIISSQGRYAVIAVGNLGRPGPDIGGGKLEKVYSQVAPVINKGLLPGEPIVVIAHSDGNQLVQGVIDLVRNADGVPGKLKKGFKANQCIDPTTINIQVGRLDPTFIRKPARANQVIDVGSNVPGASPFNLNQTREWASNRFLRADFRAPIGTTHDGLLYSRSIITTLQRRYGFQF
jgi:RHS repeat-associated protein